MEEVGVEEAGVEGEDAEKGEASGKQSADTTLMNPGPLTLGLGRCLQR
jgi:hypothetical protein